MSSTDQVSLRNNVASNAPHPYSSGGFARITISRPASLCFDVLTDVARWPEINKGVTNKIDILDSVFGVGARFTELISSPLPGVDDWANEWEVVALEKGVLFSIECQDQFTRVPIYSRLTYQFAEVAPGSTLFSRKIESTVGDDFIRNAPKQDLEALYRFLGSQWEMAAHLKAYMEALKVA